MIVEDDVSVCVFAGHGVGPQLLHEEDLIGELRRRAVSRRPSLLDPVGQVPDEVEEEVALRNGNDLVRDFDEKAEALGRSKVQACGDVLAKVFRAG